MSKDSNHRNRPDGIALIAESVAKLVQPPLDQLPQVFLDEKARHDREVASTTRKAGGNRT